MGFRKGSTGAGMENSVRELTISRTFDAPRVLLWRAWTDQELVQQWWGPKGVTNPVCIWEAVPDGKINIVMLAGNELGPLAGLKWPMEGTFVEVSPERRLVFQSNALGDQKEALIETVITVDLQDEGEKTEMVVHVTVLKAVSGKTGMMLQGMEAGWNQQIDKLGGILKEIA